MKLNRTMLALTLPILVGLAAALTLTPRATAKDDTVLYLNCFSIQMDSGRSGNIDIGIERWSEPGELDTLKTVLIEQGTDQLLKAVQKIKPRAGFIRTDRSLGWDIHFAQQTPLPGGGTKVVFITDRPITGLEARENPRSRDYEFMLAEIHLDKDNGMRGQGKLAGAAKVTYNEETKTIEIENWGTEPVRLSDVQVRK